MCPSHDLGTITIGGRFRILGLFKVGVMFIGMGFKEIFSRTIRLKKDTSDLMYSINAEVNILNINKR